MAGLNREETTIDFAIGNEQTGCFELAAVRIVTHRHRSRNAGVPQEVVEGGAEQSRRPFAYISAQEDWT